MRKKLTVEQFFEIKICHIKKSQVPDECLDYYNTWKENQLSKRRIKDRKYHDTHKEIRNEKRRQYCLDNPNYESERAKKYREENKEKVKAYLEKTREKRLAKAREYKLRKKLEKLNER